MTPLPWKEDITLDPKTYYHQLIQDIHDAKKTIDLEVYIFENDLLGQQVIEQLIEASKRGVSIRILVDGAGSPFWGKTLSHKLQSWMIQSKVFHPLPWHFWQWHEIKSPLSTLEKVQHLLSQANRRNHRKTCIIDQKTAWVGSFNIAECHLSEAPKWHDIAVRLEGGNFHELQKAFEKAWSHSFFQRYPPILQTPFRLNNTRRRRKKLYQDLIGRLSNAKQQIWITNAYFIPTRSLLDSLKKSAASGVDVRLLLPQESDVFFMPWSSGVFYQELLGAGIQIFEYTQGILHSKVMIIDNWCTVGSSNLNSRSLMHDLEIDVVLQRTESKEVLKKRFLSDLQGAEPILQEDCPKRPRYQRWIGRMMLWIKYWL